MGLFGISEVFLNLEEALSREILTRGKIAGLLPSLQDWGRVHFSHPAGIGSGFPAGDSARRRGDAGIFASYTMEKKYPDPKPFGTGMIEGVGRAGSGPTMPGPRGFYPLLCLGIPCNVIMALLIGPL